MKPERTLFSLIAVGTLAGGVLYGDYWKKKRLPQGDLGTLQAENSQLTKENDRLTDELAQLRSLLSGTPLPIPEELITFVEKDLGLVFLKTPKAKLGTPSDLRDVAERNLRLVYGEDGIGTMERTWELLGLLPAGQNLESQWIVVETVGARGIFDIASNEIILAGDYQAGDIEDTGILVAMLTRQLLLQNFPKPQWQNHDDWNAWLATHRGAAESVSARYLRKRGVTAKLDRKREDLLSQLSSTVQGLANFPYLEGHDFIQANYLKSRQALLESFKVPPRSTLTIIRPDQQSPPLSHITIYERNKDGVQNRIGALGLRLLLDPLLGMDLSSGFANRWKNDEYSYHQDKLIWHLKMDSPQTAEGLFKKLSEIALLKLKRDQPDRQVAFHLEKNRITFTNEPQK